MNTNNIKCETNNNIWTISNKFFILLYINLPTNMSIF